MSRCMQCHDQFHEPLHILNFYKATPLICPLCEQQWEDMRISKGESSNVRRCERCLKVLAEDETACLDCTFLEQSYRLIDQLYCTYQYKGIVRETIHQYKFLRDVALAEVIASKVRLPQEQFDYIVPIPSPVERDRDRTFSPVKVVLDQMGVHYTEMLETRIRPKQSALGKMKRARSANPFTFNSEINIANKSILLVDDIYTTGLTVHNAGAQLYVRKIRKLGVLTFAR